jgi:acyl-CoA-dependent ceramide synthase
MATKTAPPNANGTLNSTHAAELQEQKIAIAPKRRKTSTKKPKDEGLMATLCALVCDHQIGMLSVIPGSSIGD